MVGVCYIGDFLIKALKKNHHCGQNNTEQVSFVISLTKIF